MEFKDRVANKPNRVKLIYDEGGASVYATVELADEPIEEGTPLNALNMNKLLNKEDNDYVVEQVINYAGWSYRKWASGFAECWRKLSAQFNNVNVSEWKSEDGTINSGFYSLGDLPETNLDLPFMFKFIPNVDISLQQAPVSVFITKSAQIMPSVNQTGDIKIYRPLPFPVSTFQSPFVFSYDVKGRWK